MSIKQMVIESLKDLQKIMKLSREAEELIEETDELDYFIIIDGKEFRLGKLNLYSEEFLHQIYYDLETYHIEDENVVAG